jgi:urease accessory protein
MSESLQATEAALGTWLVPLLQTSDPLFPTGSYAHSLGLEEIVQMKQVREPETFCAYLKDRLVPYLENLELPHLKFLYEAAKARDLDTLIDLDFELGAMKLTREVRQASASQGRQRLRLIRSIFPNSFLEEVADRFSEANAPCNHQTIFALQHVQQSIPVEASLLAWLYQAIAAQCAASMKLIRIGEEGCQKIITTCMEDASGVVQRAMEISREDVGWFNPVLDIASSRHERAYVRLFIS